MDTTEPTTRLGKLHRRLIDPHLGWIAIFILSLSFGLGAMFFDQRTILTLLFAGLFGLALERTTYPLPKIFGPATRLLNAVNKAVWFGVLVSLMFYYSDADITNHSMDLASKAVMYGGLFGVLNALIPTPELPKFKGLYENGSVLDHGGIYAAFVLVWPFLTAIGGLLLLISLHSPVWAGLFTAAMMGLTPINRVPTLNGRSVRFVSRISVIRLILIFCLIASIWWIANGGSASISGVI